MNKLDMFLELPDVDGLTTEIEASKRLGKVKIGALNSTEYSEITKKSRKIDRKGQVTFDDNAFKNTKLYNNLSKYQRQFNINIV